MVVVVVVAGRLLHGSRLPDCRARLHTENPEGHSQRLAVGLTLLAGHELFAQLVISTPLVSHTRDTLIILDI